LKYVLAYKEIVRPRPSRFSKKVNSERF